MERDDEPFRGCRLKRNYGEVGPILCPFFTEEFERESIYHKWLFHDDQHCVRAVRAHQGERKRTWAAIARSVDCEGVVPVLEALWLPAEVVFRNLVLLGLGPSAIAAWFAHEKPLIQLGLVTREEIC